MKHKLVCIVFLLWSLLLKCNFQSTVLNGIKPNEMDAIIFLEGLLEGWAFQTNTTKVVCDMCACTTQELEQTRQYKGHNTSQLTCDSSCQLFEKQVHCYSILLFTMLNEKI